MVWGIFLIILAFLWAIYIVIQSKLSSAVKRGFRALDGTGNIYFGRTPGWKFTQPQAVILVSCDHDGEVRGCQRIILSTMRMPVVADDWSEIVGEVLPDINIDQWTDDAAIKTAFMSLMKNYRKYCSKAR